MPWIMLGVLAVPLRLLVFPLWLHIATILSSP